MPGKPSPLHLTPALDSAFSWGALDFGFLLLSFEMMQLHLLEDACSQGVLPGSNQHAWPGCSEAEMRATAHKMQTSGVASLTMGVHSGEQIG